MKYAQKGQEITDCLMSLLMVFLIQSIYSQVILKNRLKSLPSFHEFMTSLPKLKKS